MSNALLERNEGPSSPDDCWSVAHAEKNGKPLLIRFRSQRPQGVETAAFPFLLSATWTYPANEAGLPAPEETQLMDRFEDALAALEASQAAYLMVVLTGNGERDWLWYTHGEAEAMRQVNEALKGHKPYPVQFSVQQDRSWEAYAQFEPANGSLPSSGGPLGIIRWAGRTHHGLPRLFVFSCSGQGPGHRILR
jgi:hypothetical protein